MEFTGYDGIGPFQGIHVEKVNALNHAMDCCGIRSRSDRTVDSEFAEMLEEWFYSGNWRKSDNE